MTPDSVTCPEPDPPNSRLEASTSGTVTLAGLELFWLSCGKLERLVRNERLLPLNVSVEPPRLSLFNRNPELRSWVEVKFPEVLRLIV